jgi:sec-independent protein translocase protein TatA
MPGMWELLVIFAIVLVIFGASKLPGIGDALGRSIRNFKNAATDDKTKEVKDGKEAIEVNRQLGAKADKELGAGADDGEFEEVVVRRRIKKES